jgi:hypothetical protein
VDDPVLTQTRVFVTYLPARPAPGIVKPRPAGSLGSPAVTGLAGAMLAGGLVHALSGAEAVSYRSARPALDTAPSVGISPTPGALPFLALASTAERPSFDFTQTPGVAVAAEIVASPAKPIPSAGAPARKRPAADRTSRALAGKRLDLAGFLDDQGFALTPASAPFAASALSPVETPAALAPPAEIESAEAGIAQDVAPTAEPPAVPSAQAQTFPTVTVAGVALGAVTMRGDAVHLGSLVGLLQLRMPDAELVRLQSAPAADSFVSLDTLRAAGIEIAIDPEGESLALAAR